MKTLSPQAGLLASTNPRAIFYFTIGQRESETLPIANIGVSGVAVGQIPFRQLSSIERFPTERRDCAVRALTIASGLTYAVAHSRCQAGGRRSKFGFNDRKFAAVLKISGFEECPIFSGCTLADLMPALARGRFVVWVNEHYFAVVDGIVTDMLACPEGPRRRVKWVYRLNDILPTTTEQHSQL